MLAPIMHQNLHFMIDLETLGTASDCIISEVSAVAFEIDTGKIVAERTWHTSVEDQINLGRKVSSGTLAFWLTQSQDARNKMLNSMDEFCNRNFMRLPVAIEFFLDDFKNFIQITTMQWELENKTSLIELGRKEVDLPDPRVWGNGIKFDLGKLSSLYGKEDNVPWEFWAERDVHTLVDLLPLAKKETKFEGTPHYGLDDCRHQIKYIVKVYQAILEAANK